MSPDTLIFGYVVLTLGTLAVFGLYHEHQRRRFEPMPTRDEVFRCEQCGFVYTDDEDVDLSRCPQCGRTNGPVEF